MSPFVPLLLLAATLNAEGHEKENPLYREMRDKGVSVGGTLRSPLPAPLMPDGLDPKAQRAVIEKLAGDDYPIDELMRKAVVAPHVYKFREVKPSDPEAPAYGVDLWFIAHGDLETLAKKDASTFFQSVRKEVKLHVLTPEELKERGLKEEKVGNSSIRYAHTSYPLLEKVELSFTSRNLITRTGDSLLLATTLDPAFVKDEKYPNRWRAIVRDGDDEVKHGPPHPYDGNGMYMKVTRLAEPKAALFVEFHRVSTEPKKWFDGANLLRSKMPILIQAEVRSFRRELEKPARD
jgi:hypothetical protein